MNQNCPLATIGLSPWVAVAGGMSTRTGVAGTEADAPKVDHRGYSPLLGVTRLR